MSLSISKYCKWCGGQKNEENAHLDAVQGVDSTVFYKTGLADEICNRALLTSVIWLPSLLKYRKVTRPGLNPGPSGHIPDDYIIQFQQPTLIWHFLYIPNFKQQARAHNLLKLHNRVTISV